MRASPRIRGGTAVLRLASCLVTVIGLGAPARGQPVTTSLDSVEWMSADSPLIVRGTVVALETVKVPDGYFWHTVALRVDETLKGEHRPSLRFMLQSNGRDPKAIERWKVRGVSLLIFLKESRCVVAMWRYKEWTRFPFAPRTGYPERSILELAPGSSSKAYDLSLKALDGPEAILRATREAIAAPRGPEKPCDSWIDLPGQALIRLTVPIDSRLEARARGWVRSPDKDLRQLGAANLVYFHTDANVAILRDLLDDPGTSDVQSLDDRRVERVERVHVVREEAHSILRAWGYDVPRPPTRVLLSRP